MVFDLLKINGINATNVKLKWAQQAVRKAKGMVRLHIKKVPNRQVHVQQSVLMLFTLSNCSLKETKLLLSKNELIVVAAVQRSKFTESTDFLECFFFFCVPYRK